MTRAKFDRKQGEVQDPELKPVKKDLGQSTVQYQNHYNNFVYLEVNSSSDTSSEKASLIPDEQHCLEPKNESEIQDQVNNEN